MLINGEWFNDTPTFPVFNPATGEEIGQVADGTEQDAARAIDAARAALPAWMNETAYARSAVLYRAYQLMLCLLYTSPSPRDATLSRMPSSA